MVGWYAGVDPTPRSWVNRRNKYRSGNGADDTTRNAFEQFVGGIPLSPKGLRNAIEQIKRTFANRVRMEQASAPSRIKRTAQVTERRIKRTITNRVRMERESRSPEWGASDPRAPAAVVDAEAVGGGYFRVRALGRHGGSGGVR